MSGVQRDNLEEWVMNTIQSKIHPMLLPFFAHDETRFPGLGFKCWTAVQLAPGALGGV